MSAGISITSLERRVLVELSHREQVDGEAAPAPIASVCRAVGIASISDAARVFQRLRDLGLAEPPAKTGGLWSVTRAGRAAAVLER